MNKDLAIENNEIRNLSYKVIYEDDVFKFGFAETNSNEELEIKAEFELTDKEFKVYLLSLLSAAMVYSNETGRNLIKELIEEID